jgi:hypothetical protein
LPSQSNNLLLMVLIFLKCQLKSLRKDIVNGFLPKLLMVVFSNSNMQRLIKMIIALLMMMMMVQTLKTSPRQLLSTTDHKALKLSTKLLILSNFHLKQQTLQFMQLLILLNRESICLLNNISLNTHLPELLQHLLNQKLQLLQLQFKEKLSHLSRTS